MPSKTVTSPYAPHPGTEYPFSIGDIAFATARALGDAFTGDSGCWGVTGQVHGAGDRWTISVDYEGDLCLTPEHGTDPIHYFPDLTAGDGLDEIAAAVAEAIRVDIVRMATHPLKSADDN
ncbi:hypothetical protein [Streptomyces subrutilus]|uniref:Uncharacterized protein n=1 Tax=Streptomyces subrutilus TaxID=36818 RepID=A0A1E5NY32_9ACTN|nr:hypothetical protein [Streptomyces subrutilus]OEJ21047.1 hypothetical protein BGK67_34695 [Streptomyces subrutilus]